MYKGNLGNIDKQDAIDALQEAQDLLFQAIEKLEWVADRLEDRHAEAYIIDHLKILASDNHGFLDSSYNLGKWIEDVSSTEDEEEDEPEDEEEDR